MDKNISKCIVTPDYSIKRTLSAINDFGYGVAIVVSKKDSTLIGILTDGDIRRAIINGANLAQPIKPIINTKFLRLSKNECSVKEIEMIFSGSDVRMIPVVEKNILVDIFFKEDFLKNQTKKQTKLPAGILDIPLVIMAGGKGKRLEPFTAVLPKALIPIENKPIIEIIIEEFSKYKINKFLISLNDKAEMIKAYFKGSNKAYNISYVIEKMPLGTIGALRLMRQHLSGNFFLSNCDIIIKADFSKIYEFHKKGNYDLTIVGANQCHIIPYGVCVTNSKNELSSFDEKPEKHMLVNTGLYIVNSRVLKLIPDNTAFQVTDLIGKLLSAKRNIGVFSVEEKDFFDIGKWDEYKKTVRHFNEIAI